MLDEKRVWCRGCKKYDICGMVERKLRGLPRPKSQDELLEDVGIDCEEFELRESLTVEQEKYKEQDEASLKKKLIPWQVMRIERLMRLIDNFEGLFLEYKEEDLTSLSKRPDTLIRAVMLFNQQIKDGVDILMSLSGAKKEEKGLDPEVLVQVLLSMNPCDREVIQKLFLSMLPKLKMLSEKVEEKTENKE